MAEKLSNGDENKVLIKIENHYPYKVDLTVIEEAPFQFQERKLQFNFDLKSNEEKTLQYFLKPLERGEYVFGKVNVYVATLLNLVKKRMSFGDAQKVPVYPSYMQMRKYELIAISNKLAHGGIKKIRKIGHTMEFDQIREFVVGDDLRNINWKATARTQDLKLNQYQDEKSQQIISIIDKGRVMKMPFEGMTLLDYAINSSLVISNIALLKHDKPGLITFDKDLDAYIQAEHRGTQMRRIMEILYNQKTNFLESNYEKLFAFIRRKITSRSLLLFYTNFESTVAMKRQLPYLMMLAKYHLLVVIFFENTELNALLHSKPQNVEEVYIKTIAEKFELEKRQMVQELQHHGIHSLLTSPQNLTVNAINKYLEIKSRGIL